MPLFGSKKKEKSADEKLQDAREMAKFAMEALQDKDADLAAKRIKQALKCLDER